MTTYSLIINLVSIPTRGFIPLSLRRSRLLSNLESLPLLHFNSPHYQMSESGLSPTHTLADTPSLVPPHVPLRPRPCHVPFVSLNRGQTDTPTTHHQPPLFRNHDRSASLNFDWVGRDTQGTSHRSHARARRQRDRATESIQTRRSPHRAADSPRMLVTHALDS